MESVIRAWTGEQVVLRHDKQTEAWLLVAIHSTREGRAGGGTRMKPYPNLKAALEDVTKLSEAMSYKFALSGLSYGGAKCVICLPEQFDLAERPDLLRRYGELIQSLGGLFYTGPDVGTTSEDMDVVAETGAPYVFGRTPAGGGVGSSGPPTAIGVFAGIEVICDRLFGTPSLQGRRVLVQGLGSVGEYLSDDLLTAGAEVLFTDVVPSTVEAGKNKGLQYVPPEEVYGTTCDIFSPNALGGVLNAQTIPELNCRGIAGGANNQLATAADPGRLLGRGILYAPDFVVNIGGAMAIVSMESLGWNREEAIEAVRDNVKHNLKRVFELAERKGITTDVAGQWVAEERLISVGD